MKKTLGVELLEENNQQYKKNSLQDYIFYFSSILFCFVFIHTDFRDIPGIFFSSAARSGSTGWFFRHPHDSSGATRQMQHDVSVM